MLYRSAKGNSLNYPESDSSTPRELSDKAKYGSVQPWIGSDTQTMHSRLLEPFMHSSERCPVPSSLLQQNGQAPEAVHEAMGAAISNARRGGMDHLVAVTSATVICPSNSADPALHQATSACRQRIGLAFAAYVMSGS